MSRFVKHLILLGEDAVKIERTLRDVVDIRFVTSMDQAVLEAFRVAKHGDHILLSPACASMDMFKNYEHRGDAFIAAVKRLQSSVFE